MSISLLLLEFPNTTIKGDCSIIGFENNISLSSFSWGLSAENRKSGENPKNSIKLDVLEVSKYYDSASIAMSNMIVADSKFSKAILRFIDPRETSSESMKKGAKFDSIMEIELLDGHIESISLRTQQSRQAMAVAETVVLSFNRIIIGYNRYLPYTRVRSRGPVFEAEQPSKGVGVG